MQPATKEDVDFEVQAALAWHDDDVNATIATLLEDIRHLRRQLILSQTAISRGMKRGWSPHFQRS
ncbi:hypothetical protein [Rhizobium sp. Root1220]|uniref:hypothetical protein n=1 Tax=Rhizobium sp. Root1220 TaxID=1736432 RepID=UPI0006FA648A|nr:hypothetical protein [Rhizobium sp. Root1220]KQV80015.1 dehydrogenase [Rhizobium sp. Root1220]